MTGMVEALVSLAGLGVTLLVLRGMRRSSRVIAANMKEIQRAEQACARHAADAAVAEAHAADALASVKRIRGWHNDGVRKP